MKFKPLMVCLAGIILCGSIASVEARTNFSINLGLGALLVPPPRVYERYVVEPYYPYYSDPVYMYPAPRYARPVYAVPRPCYREVFVEPAPVYYQAPGFYR